MSALVAHLDVRLLNPPPVEFSDAHRVIFQCIIELRDELLRNSQKRSPSTTQATVPYTKEDSVEAQRLLRRKQINQSFNERFYSTCVAAQDAAPPDLNVFEILTKAHQEVPPISGFRIAPLPPASDHNEGEGGGTLRDGAQSGTVDVSKSPNDGGAESDFEPELPQHQRVAQSDATRQADESYTPPVEPPVENADVASSTDAQNAMIEVLKKLLHPVRAASPHTISVNHISSPAAPRPSHISPLVTSRFKDIEEAFAQPAQLSEDSSKSLKRKIETYTQLSQQISGRESVYTKKFKTGGHSNPVVSETSNSNSWMPTRWHSPIVREAAESPRPFPADVFGSTRQFSGVLTGLRSNTSSLFQTTTPHQQQALDRHNYQNQYQPHQNHSQRRQNESIHQNHSLLGTSQPPHQYHAQFLQQSTPDIKSNINQSQSLFFGYQPQAQAQNLNFSAATVPNAHYLSHGNQQDTLPHHHTPLSHLPASFPLLQSMNKAATQSAQAASSAFHATQAASNAVGNYGTPYELAAPNPNDGQRNGHRFGQPLGPPIQVQATGRNAGEYVTTNSQQVYTPGASYVPPSPYQPTQSIPGNLLYLGSHQPPQGSSRH